MEGYKSVFEEYNNKILNGYKTIIGRAMIGLTIGLAAVLIMEFLYIKEESKKDKVVIRRRRGDMFSISQKKTSRCSPFDVSNLGKRIARRKIWKVIRESRERT